MGQPWKRRQHHCFFWCTSGNVMSNSTCKKLKMCFLCFLLHVSANELFTVGRSFNTIGRSRDALMIQRIVLSKRLCHHRMGFVCLAVVNSYSNHIFVSCSGAIVWPSIGIVLASTVDQFWSHLRAKFKILYLYDHLVLILEQCDACIKCKCQCP